MVTKAEMHKKMIKTVLDKCPQFIKNYSPKEKELLDEFLKLLKDFEKAEIKRTDLINSYELYNKSLLGTTRYLQTPFLWFTVAYIQKARFTLNWSNFQAESFYEYLSRFLRKDPVHYGVYELLRKQTPLSDIKWEQLQYACSKILKPLSKEQMKIIEGLISIIKNQGIYSLDPQIIKKKCSSIFPKGTKVDKVLSAFLTNLESQWYINYHSPAFGIERIFFHIEGVKVRIDEIIPFQDPNNTILGMSDIYVSKDNLNDFLGIFYIPTQDVKALSVFLYGQEQRGTFKIKDLSHIKTSIRGISLERYKADKGWPILSKTDMRKFSQLLQGEKEEKAHIETATTNFSPKFNKKWLFTQHQLPEELIRLYCNVKNTYFYSELPTPSVSKKSKKSLTKTNIGLLKQLNYNNIIYIDWIPWRLVFEFSLDNYWVKIPKSFMKKIIHFMKIIPFSNANIADEKIYMWLHLTPQMVHWLKNDLNWEIYTINRYTTPYPPSFKWFNQEELCWKTPKILIPNKE